MNQQPLTAEQLAEQLSERLLNLFDFSYGGQEFKDVVDHIKQAITQATEAKDREIEILKHDYEMLKEAYYGSTPEPFMEKIHQLESEKAALVEDLEWTTISQCPPPHVDLEFYCEDGTLHKGRPCYGMHSPWWCNTSGEILKDLGHIVTHWRRFKKPGEATNLTQQAQARDARLIEKGRLKGIEEAQAALEQISFDHESFNGQELVNAKQAMKRLTQLKGGG